MAYKMFTKHGYKLFDVVSALQKSIRRGDAKTAGYFALEMEASGYVRYLWRRLFVISAEDIAGCVTQEVEALHNTFLHVNAKSKKLDRPEGRLFIAKAVILLAKAYKCRDADHLIIHVYDREKIRNDDIDCLLKKVTEADRMDIPEYAYDCHTSKGKAMGKTKEDFLKAEFEALNPRERGLFDGFVGT